MDWIKERLKESSTYTGLSILAGVVGYTIAPGAFELIGGGVLGVIGLIETIKSEHAEA